MHSQKRWQELKTGAPKYISPRKSTNGRLRINTNTVLSAQCANNLLNLNLVRPLVLNVEVPVDHKKYEEASQKRVEAGKADEIHRQKRAKDSYLCYLVYMKMRERER